MDIPFVGTSTDDLDLIQIAKRTIDEILDDRHGVHSAASALRTSDGSVFRGIDVIHASGGSPAELVAIANARAFGANQIKTIVTVGSEGRGPLPPCGKGRQVLLDYFPTIRVIMPVNRIVQVVRIRDLLPLGTQWTLENRFVQRFDAELPADYDWPDDG